MVFQTSVNFRIAAIIIYLFKIKKINNSLLSYSIYIIVIMSDKDQ